MTIEKSNGAISSQTAADAELARRERISAIVPARNEELSIGSCLDALLRQPEILEIIVVNDQSSDRTAESVRERMAQDSRVRLLETGGVPEGWVGKNYAAAEGAASAIQAWLLFVDADAEVLPGACAQALATAIEFGAGLFSYSPEQVTVKWYEKALVPFIYCRLARKFSYEAVNDPKKKAAAANGQFLMIHRSVYDAIGGHAAVAGEILEDVAIARRVKASGYAMRFASGIGLVRARMYRSFSAMWSGWRKNLYRLMGGTPQAFGWEMESIVPWIPFFLIIAGLWFPIAILAGVLLLLLRQVRYGSELVRNRYPFTLIIYYVPAVVLYAGVLVASYFSYSRGRVEWKGREVAIRPAGAASVGMKKADSSLRSE
jgi:glycosyltransferase involved in cell wall biosynthesis